MQTILNPFSRSPRSIAAILSAAGLAAVAGCHAGGSSGTSMSSTQGGNTNSSAVMAPGATHVQQDNAMFDTTRSFPTGDKSTSVLMVEAMGPSSIHMQHESNYQIKVTNLTNMPVRNVMISSTNPDGFQTTAVSNATTQPADGNHLSYAVGDLGPNELKTINITGMATKVGPVDTCYSVTYAPPTLCTMLQVTSPALTLDVQAPPDTDICKPVTYQYTVTNTGTGVAHNVMLQENLPDGLMTTDGKNNVMANLGDIPQGQNRVVTANLKAARTGSFTGQAMAKSDDENAQPANTVTAVHAPVLAVAVTGGATDYVGKNVPYQIVVTNKGDAPAENTKLQIGSNGNGVVTADGVDSSGGLVIGELPPNGSKTINASATSNTGGNVTVVANAMADCAAPVSGTAQTMFNTIPAILLETVDEVDPVKVGDTVVYDIKVTNQGSGPDTNIKVTAVAPDGETYISTDGPTQPAVDGMNLTFPIIPSLAPKASVTWKVSLKAAKAGDVQFKTDASSDNLKGAEKIESTKLY